MKIINNEKELYGAVRFLYLIAFAYIAILI